jgi:hypothetical protein
MHVRLAAPVISLLAVLLAGMAAHAAAPRVVVDGQPVSFPDTQPEIVAGRVMVPLRAVAAHLGAGNLAWDRATRTVTVTHGERVIRLRVGRPWATSGRTAIPLETPPLLRDGRVLVPLRFVGEALGARVHWQPADRTAVIVTPAPA